MTVDQYGLVTCDGLGYYFRPTQFMVLHDTNNKTDTGLIVAILSLGLGPEERYFLALEADKGVGTRFIVRVRYSNKSM